MKLKLLFIPLSGLALMSLVNPSHGTDYKVYPGSACRPGFGADAGSFDTLGTTIKNISTQALSVTCPLVREYLPAAPANGLDPGMRVASPNGFFFTCYFYSFNQKGEVLDAVYRDTRSTIATPLTFGGRTIITEAAGTYAFLCTVPPQGIVFNYSLGEPPDYSNL